MISLRANVVRAASAIGVLTFFAAGCSATPKASVTTPGASSNAPSPGSVALAYASDIFTHRLSEAAELMVPTDEGVFASLEPIMASNAASATGLAIGSTLVSGDTAVVVLVGTLCSGPPPTPVPVNSASGGMKCVANTDPHGTDPAFIVHLEEVSGGGWYVYFPVPTPGPS